MASERLPRLRLGVFLGCASFRSRGLGVSTLVGGREVRRRWSISVHELARKEKALHTSDGGGDEGGDEGDQKGEETCNKGGALSTSCGPWAISGGPSKAGAHRAEAIPKV